MQYFEHPELVENLFTSFKIGDLAVPNRIVMAPMSRCKSPNNIPNDFNMKYYQERAKGGVGLIVTEGTCVGAPGSHGYKDVPSFFGDSALAGWKKVVDAVHGEGGLIFPQLWHVGSVRREGMAPDVEVPPYGPSEVTHPYLIQQGETEFGLPLPPVEMTQNDIDEVIAAFVVAAKDAKRLGFDGIELHAAHAYLIDQFFWSFTNKRTDKYGGKTLAERAQIGVELVSEIKKVAGNNFPLIMRISNWKFGNFDAKDADTPDKLEAFLGLLVDAGVDVFHCSAHRFYLPEYPNTGSTLNYAGWVKKLSGKPTITVGSVGLDKAFPDSFAGIESMPTTLDELARRLAQGEFDLVAIGRALLADPSLVNKLKARAFDDIIQFRSNDLDL